jgi:transcriptional regulator with XRE-family HTH domain
MAKRRTLEQAIGEELKRLREAAGVRQEAVAFAAQRFGLNWTQPTVAAIENGRRSLSLGEAGMLGSIAFWSGIARPPRRLLDFIPDTDEWVILAPGHEAPLRSIRWLYGTYEEQEAAPGYGGPSRDAGIITETDRKAARVLRVAPERVAQAAIELWNRGLAEERDRLVGDPAASAQKRGRVTRGLVRQLGQRIKEMKRRERRQADG